MLDKEKVRKKLLKDLGAFQTVKCFICGSGISRDDINTSNFERIDKRYIHTTCINKHVPRLD